MKFYRLIPALVLTGCFGADSSDEKQVPGPGFDDSGLTPEPEGTSLDGVQCIMCDARVSTFGDLREPHPVADPFRPENLVRAVGRGGYFLYLSIDGGGNRTRVDARRRSCS